MGARFRAVGGELRSGRLPQVTIDKQRTEQSALTASNSVRVRAGDRT